MKCLKKFNENGFYTSGFNQSFVPEDGNYHFQLILKT